MPKKVSSSNHKDPKDSSLASSNLENNKKSERKISSDNSTTKGKFTCKSYESRYMENQLYSFS